MTSHPAYDGLASTTDLTDGTSAVTGAYTYDVFGATLTGPSNNAWQFPPEAGKGTGEQRDADSALYYLRARYYDPAIGRFLTQDPLVGSYAQPQTQNRYAYALNNPVNRVDPTGMANEGGPFLLTAGIEIEELIELLRSPSCGMAIRDLLVGVTAVALGLLMWTAPAPSLFLGGPALAVGAIFLTRGSLGFLNNCQFDDSP